MSEDQGSIGWEAVVREDRAGGAICEFQNDDVGYRTWVYTHPHGFIVDSDSLPPRGRAMIHTARCDHVAYRPWLEGARLDGTPVSYTRSPKAKICADSQRALVEYCRASLPEGRDVARCRSCM
jgi:hypothetical protein